MSIPVFSPVFVELLADRLETELSFHPCTIQCDGESHPFYMGRAKKYRNLIDADASLYRNLSDGTTIIHKLVFRNDFEPDFLIARDEHYTSYLSVSEEFRRMVEEAGLRIDFLPRK